MVRVREIYAKSREVKLEGVGDVRDADYIKKVGYEEIGDGRKYETMVFKARKKGESRVRKILPDSADNVSINVCV